MRAPCLGCPKIGCGSFHSECKEYIAYRLEKDKENEERAKKGALYGAYIPDRLYNHRGKTNNFKCHKR